MPPLSPIRSIKNFEALADMLREQILAGEFVAGEYLPNEQKLGGLTGLSRGSVREALRVLEAQGLVATVVGRNGGRKVLQPTASTLGRAIDVFIRGQQIEFSVVLETLEILDPSLAALAARNRTDEDIATLNTLELALSASRTAAEFAQTNAGWFVAVARAGHNPLLTAVAEALGPQIHRTYVAGFPSVATRKAAILAQKNIRKAIELQDTEAARRRMARHILAYRSQMESRAPRTIELK